METNAISNKHDMWGGWTPIENTMPIVAHDLLAQVMDINVFKKKRSWPMDNELLIVVYQTSNDYANKGH